VIHTIDSTVLENRSFPGDYAILNVQAPGIAEDTFPGQFVMAASDGSEELPHPLLKRALAVYKINRRQNTISLLIKAVGEGTRRLIHLKPGDHLEMVGPLGNGFDISRGKGRINILVTGGTGIASVYLLTEHLLKYGEDVHLVYGGRTAEDLVGLNDFEALGIPLCIATEDGSKGYKGLVTGALKEYLPRFPRENLNFYTCGPNPMMKAVAQIALDARIPCQLSVESKMACGFGVCLGCSVMTKSGQKLVCTDGPVFEADSFLWEEDWKVIKKR
jgi:dihydroorotate dehydrogenase electron transfer subunit